MNCRVASTGTERSLVGDILVGLRSLVNLPLRDKPLRNG